jgi:hypothetical protein
LLNGGIVRDNTEEWIAAANTVLRGPQSGLDQAVRAVQFATSMLTRFYGAEAPQTKAFLSAVEPQVKRDGTDYALFLIAKGAITSTIVELQSGLIVNIRATVAGEVLGELARLAKEILVDKTDGAKNVGAVLVASAFEDLIRRMGEEFAGVSGRPKLESVITELKNAGILKGGEIATALSYLKFRNDSLHADWISVDLTQVQSCLAFIEALLLKHFSA